jgi:hypothetical protein
MNDDRINVITKAWETYQNLAKGFGENCWKIRSTGLGFWAAIIGYGYKNNDKNVYTFSLLVIVMFFILEVGMRQLQDKYIKKSIEIEKSINDYLVGAELSLPNDGISTNIEVPSICDFLNLLRLKKWLFWLPYLFLVLLTIKMISL